MRSRRKLGPLRNRPFAAGTDVRRACAPTQLHITDDSALNLAFSEWIQVLCDEKLTTALLDRIGHHAHILTTKGVSYRTQRRAKRGAAEPSKGITT